VVAKLKQLYERWASDIVEGYLRGAEASKGVDGLLVVCGMGGSAAAGDLIRMLSIVGGELGVEVVKSFSPLRPPQGTYTLVAVSYSGNTVETVECARLLSSGASITYAVSSGGALEKEAKAMGWIHVKLPQGYLPRAAFAYMVGALLGIAGDSLGIGENGIREASEALRKAGGELEDSIVEVVGDSGFIALDSCPQTEPLAVRAKNEFAENSKIHGKVQVYPEAAHNDIVPFSAEPIPSIIFSYKGDKRCLLVLEAVKAVYGEYGVRFVEVGIEASSVSQALRSSMEALKSIGLASVRIAEARGISPESTPAIDLYKAALRRAMENAGTGGTGL
jgi:glucose/mannose-6-phosphate isomerase